MVFESGSPIRIGCGSKVPSGESHSENSVCILTTPNIKYKVTSFSKWDIINETFKRELSLAKNAQEIITGKEYTRGITGKEYTSKGFEGSMHNVTAISEKHTTLSFSKTESASL